MAAAKTVYSPIQQGLNNIQSALGMGNYTDANGGTVAINDLPKEVQIEIQRVAALRDAGQGTPEEQAQYQQHINGMYNPDTREATMASVQQQRMQAELANRLRARDRDAGWLK
jgi:hypothetical protein